MTPLNILKAAKPALVCLDFETGIVGGEGSVEFFREDFRILSSAVAWQGGGVFILGEEDTLAVLEELAATQAKIVVHNLSFEYGVCLYRSKVAEKLNWYVDTMRLLQVSDGGGPKSGPISGYSLEKGVARWLPTQFHNHKKKFHDHLKDQGIKNVGGNLHLLPPDMLAEYNTLDAEVTLRLAQTLLQFCTEVKYDFRLDHQLFIVISKLVAQGKGLGVKVNIPLAQQGLLDVTAALHTLDANFQLRFAKEIAAIEITLLATHVGKYKSEKRRLTAAAESDLCRFNITSTKHKQMLFIGQLGLAPKFLTAKGAPTFSSKLIAQWGEGGMLLKERGSLLITITQIKKLIEKAAHTGRFHPDLAVVRTNTGRLAGAGGLNVQGLARRDKRLMGAMVADPDHTLVSIDLSAGEPTIITHFTNDYYYRQATFGMVGKAPYYDEAGVLLIDDIYLMGMSVSPLGKTKLRSVFSETFTTPRGESLTASEQWVRDPDVVKVRLKNERAFHKVLILGIGYEMGPKKMVQAALQAGHILGIKDAKAFHQAYWDLFKNVRTFGRMKQIQFERDGVLINPFGFRLLPDKPHKCLNYFIQSSINGVMNILCGKYFVIYPAAKLLTIIHDEILINVPTAALETARTEFDRCVDSLNEDLGWSVKIRCGWKEGKDLYEAK